MSLLEVNGITVAFNGHLALDGASLSVSRGEIVGLIGPNGAGKTTLLDVIAGEVRPQRGRLVLGEAEVTSLPPWRRARRGIVRTFQSGELVGSLSVQDNLMVGCQARQRTSLLEDGLRIGRSRRAELLARAEVARVLSLAGLEADAGRQVAALPLGRRRLVEIARALCAAPRLLLLDEAGSGMSAADLAALATLLRRLTGEEGLGVLVVEHDVDFVFGLCDFVYLIAGGRMVARGAPAAVRSHPQVRQAYTGESGDPTLAAAV